MMCLSFSGMTEAADPVEEAWQASWIGAAEKSASRTSSLKDSKSPIVVIQQAFYGEKGNPAKQVDLTKKIQQAVASGQYRVIASNGFAGRDPAFGLVKTLELEFTVDGKVTQTSLQENAHYDLVQGMHQESQPNDVNQWSGFRKVIHLDQAPGQAIARISRILSIGFGSMANWLFSRAS